MLAVSYSLEPSRHGLYNPWVGIVVGQFLFMHQRVPPALNLAVPNMALESA